MIEQYMVYRPPKRKKTKKIPLYIYTTSDKFSRIIAESDTQEELAKMIGLLLSQHPGCLCLPTSFST